MKASLPIEVDPEIMSGTPVFRGTRVPVQSLFEHLESDFSVDEFIKLFPTVRRGGRDQCSKGQRMTSWLKP